MAMVKVSYFHDASLFAVGTRVFVNGESYKGAGRVVLAVNPFGDELPDTTPAKLDQPFPQIVVALDELNDKGNRRLVHFNGEDLASGKVIGIAPFALGPLTADLDAICHLSKYAHLLELRKELRSVIL